MEIKTELLKNTSPTAFQSTGKLIALRFSATRSFSSIGSTCSFLGEFNRDTDVAN
jgi:hypothetical protein